MGASKNKVMSKLRGYDVFEAYYYSKGKRFHLAYYISMKRATMASDAREALPEGRIVAKPRASSLAGKYGK